MPKQLEVMPFNKVEITSIVKEILKNQATELCYNILDLRSVTDEWDGSEPLDLDNTTAVHDIYEDFISKYDITKPTLVLFYAEDHHLIKSLDTSDESGNNITDYERLGSFNFYCGIYDDTIGSVCGYVISLKKTKKGVIGVTTYQLTITRYKGG